MARLVKMPNIQSSESFKMPEDNTDTYPKDCVEDDVMEQILAGIGGTPIGQVLQRIAALPEVSQDHVLDVRQRISEGTYDLNDRLDLALDRVLEDLTAG